MEICTAVCQEGKCGLRENILLSESEIRMGAAAASRRDVHTESQLYLHLQLGFYKKQGLKFLSERIKLRTANTFHPEL